MPDIGSFLNPLSGAITAISGLLERYIPSAEDKAKVTQALLQIQTDAMLKMAEFQQQLFSTQASVVTAEVNSDSWAAKNWRPILMLSFTYIIVHNYVLLPVFHLTPVTIPDRMWDLLELGIGGYIGARTIEKAVPAAITAAKGGK